MDQVIESYISHTNYNSHAENKKKDNPVTHPPDHSRELKPPNNYFIDKLNF